MILFLFLFLLLGFCIAPLSAQSPSTSDAPGALLSSLVGKSHQKLPLAPSMEALELMGVQFVDALIKKGQMEMAKGAFKTQLEVLEKVHPDQFDKYKKLKVDDLAADAVMQQAEMAKLQPKSGNAFIDMLNGNGIPIGSSIRGLEDAIRTQRDMENTDPSEQIAKAVMDKFQTQILPGLVANMIAGKNPFKMPQQMRKAQAAPSSVFQQALAQRAMLGKNAPVAGGRGEEQRMMMNRVDQRMQQRELQEEDEDDDDLEDEDVPRRRSSDGEPQSEAEHQRRDLARRLKSSPRLKELLQNAEVQSLLSYQRMRDSPLSKRRPLAMNDEDESAFRAMEARAKLDQKSQLVLGLHGFGESDDDEDEEDENLIDPSENSFRRAPLRLSSGFVEKLKSNDELKSALDRIKYRVDDVEKYLAPKPMEFNPKPQPGYFAPRKIPTRPRKMLPLLIGSDPKVQEEIRRHPSTEWKIAKESRVLTNLKNNPSLAALFMDDKLENTLKGRQMLTDEQKGRTRVKTIRALPRLFGAPTAKAEMIDAKVFQDIEERPIPPLFFEPKGRHTRLRWTGANEKEIPGLGSRFILPSLDPTMPALNTAFSTQGRARDEWDTMFKIPNNWNPGDEVGFKMNSKTKRFVGGNGAFDMPALGL
ncbi:TPR_REGION domain-containing protein [Caenorhabditis elegans]|uniref:Osmotic stress resistance protein n=1 Tax=Caenorhabditis elegans TaxID=6239 RepID=G5EEJ4_CAEEL|nr:TPR_REGION domain-containing protein [Caenorhabditis elegans]AAR12229.1 osmotic stress resistance protein [Caenorhabditis elegans]CCD61580.1 TPR_REGION domain-containing protein [Caenorhabditis elegans]|eukprot:NP_491545.2 Uncharacterized protein CELE_C32E12.3 [Caenorhabditis elegans]